MSQKELVQQFDIEEITNSGCKAGEWSRNQAKDSEKLVIGYREDPLCGVLPLYLDNPLHTDRVGHSTVIGGRDSGRTTILQNLALQLSDNSNVIISTKDAEVLQHKLSDNTNVIDLRDSEMFDKYTVDMFNSSVDLPDGFENSIPNLAYNDSESKRILTDIFLYSRESQDGFNTFCDLLSDKSVLDNHLSEDALETEYEESLEEVYDLMEIENYEPVIATQMKSIQSFVSGEDDSDNLIEKLRSSFTSDETTCILLDSTNTTDEYSLKKFLLLKLIYGVQRESIRVKSNSLPLSILLDDVETESSLIQNMLEHTIIPEGRSSNVNVTMTTTYDYLADESNLAQTILNLVTNHIFVGKTTNTQLANKLAEFTPELSRTDLTSAQKYELNCYIRSKYTGAVTVSGWSIPQL